MFRRINWKSNIFISIVIVVVFLIFISLNRNIGYQAFKTQYMKIDTLENECRELREQISKDSAILESLSDSASLDYILHAEMQFVGEGETMYEIKRD